MKRYENATLDEQKAMSERISRDLYCQSSLIDEMLRADLFSYDDIENLYHYVCPECGDTVDMDDEPEICECCGKSFDDIGEPESEPQKIYEWYLIQDSWLVKELKRIGEPVLCTDYGNWWGRTCTGQAIVCDPTFWIIFGEHVYKWVK